MPTCARTRTMVHGRNLPLKLAHALGRRTLDASKAFSLIVAAA